MVVSDILVVLRFFSHANSLLPTIPQSGKQMETAIRASGCEVVGAATRAACNMQQSEAIAGELIGMHQSDDWRAMTGMLCNKAER